VSDVLDDDLFEPVEETTYGLGEHIGRKPGRYHFPAPPGERPANGNGWMRMTNLASAFSDQEKLQDWLTWKAMMGLRTGDGVLFDEWMAERVERLEEKDQKALALQYAKKARNAAEADAGGRRGTAQHDINEHYLNTGEIVGARAQQARLRAALAEFERCGFEVIPGTAETQVWNPIAGGVMGRYDFRIMCTRTGQCGIGDWKTQMRFWTYQEVCGQMYGYDSAPWSWQGPPNDSGFWVPSEVNTLMGHPKGPLRGRRVAIVMHMPREGTECTAIEVDLEYGKRVLEQAAGNVELRSIGRSVAVARMPAAVRMDA
jgi:hypothetical protein